jgi:hypothetical protein
MEKKKNLLARMGQEAGVQGAHGGKAEDAFDVVIPSIPGHGFSGKPTEPGWNPVRIAVAANIFFA